MEVVKVFGENTLAHKKLEAAASLMTLLSPNQKRYSVDECWFDYGSKTAWTTILGESELEAFPTYQALYPRRQEAILKAETAEDLLNEVKKFLADDSRVKK